MGDGKRAAAVGDAAVAVISGWLSGSARRLSPNCDERPIGTVVDLLVVHGISLPPARFGDSYVIDLFQNRLDTKAHPYFASLAGLRVSSHVLIRRDGSLVQFVPFQRRAWHAGVSCFDGRERCNDFSIGVELEGADDIPYTPMQYERLASVTSALMAAYPAITEERIVGHSDIAPGRKTDPGPVFDWSYFHERLRDRSGKQ